MKTQDVDRNRWVLNIAVYVLMIKYIHTHIHNACTHVRSHITILFIKLEYFKSICQAGQGDNVFG